MKTFDKWDWIGTAVATLVIALWVAHAVLPSAPPEVDPDGAPGLSAPGLAAPGGPAPAFVR